MELEFSGRSTAAAATRAVEWPTMAVVGGVFGGYGLLTGFHNAIPVWLLIPMLAYVLTWQTSLQHEIIHGHPTKWTNVNRLIGMFSLNLFLPYEHYRTVHLLHHRDQYLTDPTIDGESFYVTPQRWADTGRVMRRVLAVHHTLAGRLLLNPLFTLSGYLSEQVVQVATGKHPEAEGCPRRRWLGHAPFVALTVIWLAVVDFPPIPYFLAVYFSISLMRLRSFAEHRWTPDGRPRTATVHAAPPLALLFLNNNLHVAHHARMTVPWYELPRLSNAMDADELSRQGAGLYSGYLDVGRQYALHPIDTPIYPGRLTNPDAT